MRVADYMRNASQGRDLSRRALGITASNDDSAVGVAAANTANGGTGVLFGGSRNCTGIKDYVISLRGGRSAARSKLTKLLLYSCPIRLSGAATEIFYVKAGHAPILAYIPVPLRGAPDRGANGFLRLA